MPARRGQNEIYSPHQGRSFAVRGKSEEATWRSSMTMEPFTSRWALKRVCPVQELKEAFVAEGSDCDRLIVAATVSAERRAVNASYEVAKIAM